MAFKLFRKEIKMKVKDIIERNKTVLLYDFVNRELEKALNRAKELNEKEFRRRIKNSCRN